MKLLALLLCLALVACGEGDGYGPHKYAVGDEVQTVMGGYPAQIVAARRFIRCAYDIRAFVPDWPPQRVDCVREFELKPLETRPMRRR